MVADVVRRMGDREWWMAEVGWMMLDGECCAKVVAWRMEYSFGGGGDGVSAIVSAPLRSR